MDKPPERKIIVVDGTTNSGKTTAVNLLRKQTPGVTQVKFSDYYHKSVQRETGSVCYDFSRLDSGLLKGVVEANYLRYGNLLKMVEESPLDDYLIERLHPTDYVYQKILFGQIKDFSQIEDKLNELDAKLVILTLDDESLKYRMEATLEQRSRKNGANFEIPQHLMSYEHNLRKRDLYLEFYERSQVQDKILVDTSNNTESDLVNRIK